MSKLAIEDRIKRWRETGPGEEYETYVELLCDAETALRRLRADLRRARPHPTSGPETPNV